MNSSKAERQKEIVKSLPGVLDSLADTVEAGFGFDHAVFTFAKEHDNELARAFAGLIQEIQSEIESLEAAGKALAGVRRRALLNMARRVDVPDVTTFANVILHTDQLGGPGIAGILRALAARMAVMNKVEADFENMRAAWTWAVEQRNYAAIDRAIETLHWFCHSRRRYQEADTLFRLAREGLAPRPGEKPHPVWAKIAARYLAPGEDHKTQIERSLAIAQDHGDQAESAYCLYALGNAAVWPQSPEERDLSHGIIYYEQSLAHYRELDDKFYMAEVLGRIGWCYQSLGQQDDAVKFARQSLDLSLEIGDQPARGSFPFVPPGDGDV